MPEIMGIMLYTGVVQKLAQVMASVANYGDANPFFLVTGGLINFLAEYRREWVVLVVGP